MAGEDLDGIAQIRAARLEQAVRSVRLLAASVARQARVVDIVSLGGASRRLRRSADRNERKLYMRRSSLARFGPHGVSNNQISILGWLVV